MKDNFADMVDSLLDGDVFKDFFRPSFLSGDKEMNESPIVEDGSKHKRLIHPIIAEDAEVERIRQIVGDRINKNVHAKTAYLIAAISRILDEHKQYGKLTVRQVYYQLVSKGLIENSKTSYQNYDHHLTTGRKAGVIPWDVFEDRARTFYEEVKPQYDLSNIDTPQQEIKAWFRTILSSVLPNNYDLPKWKDQRCYVELWVEKDALAGFLSPLCEFLGVGLVVSRGYTSFTFKAEADRRFERMLQEENKTPILVYLGDLDPSGYDIFRCLKDELQNINVERIGLHPNDITQFGLIPNPVKDSDRRTKGFKNLFPELRNNVYELDALPPGELMDRARRNILKYFDQDKYEENQKTVRHWRANLTDYQAKIKKVLRKTGINLEN